MNSTLASRYASWVLKFPASNRQILLHAVMTMVWLGVYIADEEKKMLLAVVVAWFFALLDALLRKGVRDILAGMRQVADQK